MVDRCCADDELQAWIDGELDHEADARLERHVDACVGCADRLQELARLEELVRRAATVSARRHARPLLAGRGNLPGAFAVAAALVLGLRLPSPWESGRAVSERASVEICADVAAAECTSPVEPIVPDDALATFPDDDDQAPRGLCIVADDGAAPWLEPVCIDGEILAG